jgi:tetratricopeptide (TPR) repeat protein
MPSRLLFPVFVLFFSGFPVFSQLNSTGAAAVSKAAADQYLSAAEQFIGEGRWDEALDVLERGGDFADLSSDLSYLLAQARRRLNLPLPGVLEALGRAFDAGCWERYSFAQACLLEAEVFIALRNYSGALRSLDSAEQGVSEPRIFSGPEEGRVHAGPLGEDEGRAVILRILALKGLPDPQGFRRFLMSAMNRYPRDPRPVEIVFSWAAGDAGLPEADQALVDLALRRLPFLLDESPRLAYLAAPFIRDAEEARRLVSAYRALGTAEKESLPVSMDLGLIDDRRAVEELFEAGPEAVLEREMILRFWSLLGSREGRELFHQRLRGYSGMISSDSDRDGRNEALVRYSGGIPREYRGDADQDGLPETRILFSPEGIPLQGEFTTGGRRIAVQWERYPAVLKAETGDLTFTAVPENFFFAPLRFTPLVPAAGGLAPAGGGEPGILYPEADGGRTGLSPRTLAAYALTIQRPSREFPGALEQIEMEQGVPRRAVEILDGKIIAVTEFNLGLPRIQRLDLDLDGRMETVRYFREGRPADESEPLGYEAVLELVETDRDRDGLYEIGERFLSDGTVEYSWDTDGDGIRDYVETRKGAGAGLKTSD